MFEEFINCVVLLKNVALRKMAKEVIGFTLIEFEWFGLVFISTSASLQSSLNAFGNQ